MPLIITSLVNIARCRPPIGYRCRSSWPERSQVNTVTGDCQLHHRRIDFSFPAALAVFTRFFLKSWFTTTTPLSLTAKQMKPSCDVRVFEGDRSERGRFYIWPLPSRKSLRQWKKRPVHTAVKELLTRLLQTTRAISHHRVNKRTSPQKKKKQSGCTQLLMKSTSHFPFRKIWGFIFWLTDKRPTGLHKKQTKTN